MVFTRRRQPASPDETPCAHGARDPVTHVHPFGPDFAQLGSQRCQIVCFGLQKVLRKDIEAQFFARRRILQGGGVMELSGWAIRWAQQRRTTRTLAPKPRRTESSLVAGRVGRH